MTAEVSVVTGDDICAVVVTYHPDLGFQERMAAILPQVGAVVVVDNTPACTSLQDKLEAMDGRLEVLANGTNFGQATAINQGLERALGMGYRWVLTLDQDTFCHPNMVTTLANIASTCQLHPAVIGSNYLDSTLDGPRYTFRGTAAWREETTVITSGCLIDAVFARAIGGFRADYFIDQVDHEFCLRARTHGRSVVVSRQPIMAHSVGEPDGPRLPLLGIRFPGHSPLRKYYITRNSLVTMARYWRNEPDWCLRRAIKLLLGLVLMATLCDQRRRNVRAFMAGLVDGLHSKMGPCTHDWLAKP